MKGLLIDKIAELAEKGIDGEKTTAQKKLNEIGMKYGVEIKNINGMESRVRSFKYSGSESKLILSHCIWDVVCDAEIQCESTLKNLLVVLTELQYVSVMEKYKHYWKLYKQELPSYTCQFIRTQKIGLKIDGNTSNNGVLKEHPFQKIKQ